MVYKVFTGMSLYTVASPQALPGVVPLANHLGFIFQFGSHCSLWIGAESTWCIGVNWVAILLLLLVRHSVRAEIPITLPIVSPEGRV